MDQSKITKSVILNKRNYIASTLAMKAELRFIDCLKYVKGTEPDVSGDKKEKSFCLLIRCLDDNTLSFVRNKMGMEKRCGTYLRRMEQWVEDLRESTRKIQLSGFSIDNDIISRFAIRLLPPKFESLIRVLTHSDRYPEIEAIIDCVESNQAQFSKVFIKSKVALSAEKRPVKEKRKCHFCKKVGHLEKDFWKKKGVKTLTHHGKIAEEKESHDKIIGFVAAMQEQSSPIALMQDKVCSIIDSGANRHMFSSRKDFIQYKPCDGQVQIGKQGSKVSLVGRGNILKKFHGQQILLKNALHVPKIQYNLISLNEIWENNGILKKKNYQKFSICKGKEEIFSGNIRNGLLEVDFDDEGIDAQVSEHERLGHIG
ncbi:hypothetical protein O181_084803 [Austropuccinia psidii MF-1]|uniref:Retrovirus-related Pol polyprotein from transposon TNT 1-94-like beta-barrel domain-containing protein n=1 Tax=Austropuccinia psidii MF-1 TaxID=1389203 RepID=A0A9Q3FS00_9BASI|nr:hypothetical protein [Austropuccinia psidii MF-1]